MNFISSSQTPQAVNSGFRVDISRGQRIGRVSSEWFSRPDDERYLSLTELYDAVKSRADRAKARTVESRALRVEASREAAARLALLVADYVGLRLTGHGRTLDELASAWDDTAR